VKPKFRAWDTKNNCFFKPTYEAYKGNLQEIVLSMSGDINIRTMSHTLDHESTFPNRFILNQYTGLKDKNGKEIYEGDIVRYEQHLTKKVITSEVYYKEIASAFGIKNKEPRSNLFCELPVDFEIIGNIYENPLEDIPHDNHKTRQIKKDIQNTR
jgi:uncharacterized phage protein (TIGR01671 family)